MPAPPVQVDRDEVDCVPHQRCLYDVHAQQDIGRLQEYITAFCMGSLNTLMEKGNILQME